MLRRVCRVKRREEGVSTVGVVVVVVVVVAHGGEGHCLKDRVGFYVISVLVMFLENGWLGRFGKLEKCLVYRDAKLLSLPPTMAVFR